MKILAIRGKNLASLAGEFEIDFRQEPLASAGLFAICGPTGSGKSTLLDALCLALYDKTPRLNRDKADSVDLPDVGNETITPRDPRYLLRRGTGDGFAEVDFVGNDGVEYRARWSVRRARGKADGRLQSPEWLLQALNGGQHIAGGGKGEIKDAIKERLGLEFEQFTRAVLLAQNEFATFLKADKDKRADLLAKLSGLDAYTEISIRAFERAKTEQQALDALKSQLAGQQALTADERAQLERKFSIAKADAAALEQRKIELDRQLLWHEGWETLQQNEQRALKSVQQARADQEATAPRQAYLARVEAVQDARLLVDKVDDTHRDIEQSRQAVSSAEGQLEKARRIRQQTEETLAKATQAVTAAEEAAERDRPDLDRAKDLDTEIATLAPGHNIAAKALTEAREAETGAQESLTDKKTERDRTAQNLKIAQDWLAAHEALRTLAEDWPRWDMLFDEATKAQKGLREAERNIAAKRRDEQKHQQAWDKAAAQLAKAETALERAEARLQTATQALVGFDAEALAGRRAATETHREHLVSAERLWSALAGSLARQQELNEEAGTLRGKIAQAETALSQTLTAKPVAAARLEQAEKSLKTAEAACSQNVETLREHLEAGSPCPVCGATEHPYAAGDAPSRALLASLKTEVAECRKAVNVLDRQEATHQTSLENSRQRLADIAREQPLTVAIQQQTDAWNAQPVAVELAAVAPADRPAWFAARRQSMQEQLAAIVREETVQRQASKSRDEAQTARNDFQRQHSAARDALHAAQVPLDQAVQALQTAGVQHAEIARQLNERLAALDAAFPEQDWRSAWQADSATFHQSQQERATRWNVQSKTAEKLQNHLSVLDIEIGILAETALEKSEQLQRITENFAKADQALQEKYQQRQALFGGRPVADVEGELAKAIKDARTHLQNQDGETNAAVTNQASAEAILGQAQKTLNDHQQATKDAGAALNTWIAAFDARHPDEPLNLAQLRVLLAHDSAWLMREREELRQLSNAIRDAETTLRERRSQRQEHERQRATLNPMDVVQAEQAQTVTALGQARQYAIEMEIDLRRDDERRIATASLQDDIAKQEAKTEVWRKLGALIGHSKGDTFRNYAQQLTLDVLLGYANRHLTDLSRRYRLERVKDTLALMVVDQDMGDEYRSVHSLSGGESFLVSLALALGLASLSSNRVRVESLFIDEGFGSLDADTLRVAMDALDSLQAQGRKVGVISHVQDMTERIGIQIQVRRQSGGQSRIEVPGI